MVIFGDDAGRLAPNFGSQGPGLALGCIVALIRSGLWPGWEHLMAATIWTDGKM